MEEVKVSIIVPVYNAEKYLKICIESLINQTLDEIEIILIEDGSNDNSKIILEYYKKIDDRIILLFNPYNMGQSVSKNKGINIAKGKYIQFVDADDYIDKNAALFLFEKSEENQSDMCYLGMQMHPEDGLVLKAVPQTIIGEYGDVYQGKKLLRILVENNEFFYYAASVFYLTSFLRMNNLLYRELSCGEGGNFISRCLCIATRVIVRKEKLYHYRIHSESITHTEKAQIELLMGKVMRYIDILQFFANDETSNELEVFLDETYRKLNGGIQLLSNSEKVDLESRMPTSFSRHIFHMLCKKEQNYQFDFSEILLDKIRKSEYVILFGAGYASKDVLDLMQKYKIRILGFAVSKRRENEISLFGHAIYEINEIVEYKKNAIVLIASNKKYNNEIKVLLEEYGFENYEFLNVDI